MVQLTNMWKELVIYIFSVMQLRLQDTSDSEKDMCLLNKWVAKNVANQPPKGRGDRSCSGPRENQ